jgi:hypothetical protein
MSEHWPVAELDPVQRLHVMADALPGALAGQVLVRRPVEDVWAMASDLETELPRLVTDFRRVLVTPGRDGRLVAEARGHLGQRARFDVVLEPRWCWCQSRFLLCGMAATPHPEGTLFAFLGGVRVPGAALLERLFTRPATWMLRRTLRRFAERARGAGT